MATPQSRAADAEEKTAITPAPRFLTSVPPVSVMAWRRIEKCPRRTSSASDGDWALRQFGRSHNVREQDRHVLGGHCGPSAACMVQPSALSLYSASMGSRRTRRDALCRPSILEFLVPQKGK